MTSRQREGKGPARRSQPLRRRSVRQRAEREADELGIVRLLFQDREAEVDDERRRPEEGDDEPDAESDRHAVIAEVERVDALGDLARVDECGAVEDPLVEREAVLGAEERLELAARRLVELLRAGRSVREAAQ